MANHFSRRVFLMGLGGGAISASAVWGVREYALRRLVPSDERATAAACCTYAEHDGWLVTAEDKPRLQHAVVYRTGWHSLEMSQSRTWRWTHQTATLSFRNPRTDITFHLDYAGRPSLFAATPRTATLSIGDRVSHSFLVDTASRARLSIAFRAEELGNDEETELQLTVDRTVVPAETRPGSTDRRQLGILVYRASIEIAPAHASESP